MSKGMSRLRRLLRAIDGEGDADAPEQKFGLRAARGEIFVGRPRQPFGHSRILHARPAVDAGHLVEDCKALQTAAPNEILAQTPASCASAEFFQSAYLISKKHTRRKKGGIA